MNRPLVSLLLIALISATAISGYVWPGTGKKWIEQGITKVNALPASSELDAEEKSDPIETGPSFDLSQVARSSGSETGLSMSGDVVLVCESDQFFTNVGAAAMRDIVKTLEAQDIVRTVMWMDRAPPLNLFGLPEPLLPRGHASDRKFQRSREKAMRHPFVGGQLVSEDGRVMPLFISINRHLVFSDEEILSGLRELSEETAAKHPDFKVRILTTGTMPMVTTALALHTSNRLLFQVVAYSIILIMSVILFRGIIATFVLALAPAIGVFWTLGFERLFFNFEGNPFVTVVVPILVSLVGFTDGVHLLVQIRRNRAEGMPGGEAAIVGLRQVGLACGLTSLTTAIGFGSLYLADHAFVREFGQASVLGVLFAFIAVIVVIPLACQSPLGRRIHIGHQRGVIDRNLTRIGAVIDAVLKRPRTISCVAIILTVVLAGFTSLLRPDDKRMDALPANSEPALALKKLDESLGGLEQVRIKIIVPSGDENEDSKLLLEITDEVHRLVDANPLFSRPISLTSLLAALPGEGSSSQRSSMINLLPPPLLKLFSEGRFDSTVRFRCKDLGIATYGPAFENLEEKFAAIKNRYPELYIALDGEPIRRWRNLYQIVVDLASSLGMASVIIFGVLTIAFRSIRLGLISIVPNIFPLALSGAWLYFTGQALEVVSVCAFTCCLGIAVDDTIHFLTRYVEEQRVGKDRNEAIRRAFVSVGTALVMTTVVLVIGFCTVFFSDSREHRIFATLGAITISSALIGDLFFLPAMISVFDRKK